MNIETRTAPPMPGQVLAVVDFDEPEKPGEEYTRPAEVAEPADANLITSRVKTDFEDVFGTTIHKPVLDIDLPIQLLPSSTEGHFHLFIDKAMTWEKYRRLMDVLAEVGIVEHGYVNASVERGYSAVRLPWIRKNATQEGTTAL